MSVVESEVISPYSRISKKIGRGECVILDGANATELQKQGVRDYRLSDSTHWGFDAMVRAPQAVQTIHKNYLDAGADIITTNTYAILEAPFYTSKLDIQREQPLHWMDMARSAVRLARSAIEEADKGEDTAVAFSIGGDIENDDQSRTVDLLLRVFEDTPPDMVLFETVTMISDNLTIPTVQKLIDAGWPVWVSFRRCRRGVCGIYGQLWGGPEGDYFGRVAQQLEQIGAGAILINCLPMERVSGTLPWLRDFTRLPLGVYPNVGRHVEHKWMFDDNFTPDDFAEMALCWRSEGAQIIGGCCGVGPEDIQVAAHRLLNIPVGHLKYAEKENNDELAGSIMDHSNEALGLPSVHSWNDSQGRNLYPLPTPEIAVDPGVFVPTQGSYLIWKHLFNSGAGAGQHCLDVGCGAGILSIQLALNGAKEVTAIDIQKEAVANTLTNAFRNDVADRVKGKVVDLYAFSPEEKYDLIVASLYQMPTDPKGKFSGHRIIDFWGRNLIDHFIDALPGLLNDEGVVYLMQVSILGQYRTAALLEQRGFKSRLIDFNLYDFNPVFEENLEQILRVEELSDAFHFKFGDHHTLVMYLIEITHQ